MVSENQLPAMSGRVTGEDRREKGQYVENVKVRICAKKTCKGLGYATNLLSMISHRQKLQEQIF